MRFILGFFESSTPFKAAREADREGLHNPHRVGAGVGAVEQEAHHEQYRWESFSCSAALQRADLLTRMFCVAAAASSTFRSFFTAVAFWTTRVFGDNVVGNRPSERAPQPWPSQWLKLLR